MRTLKAIIEVRKSSLHPRMKYKVSQKLSALTFNVFSLHSCRLIPVVKGFVSKILTAFFLEGKQ